MGAGGDAKRRMRSAMYDQSSLTCGCLTLAGTGFGLDTLLAFMDIIGWVNLTRCGERRIWLPAALHDRLVGQ